jgi:ketosteroid isomerase-like protein
MTGKIAQIFASFGDVDKFLSLLDPDVRLIGVRARRYRELALYGTFDGHEGARRFLAGLAAAFDVQTFTIDASLEDDGQGFATGRFEHRLRVNDAILRSYWAVHCGFQNGRLLSYRFFEDTAATEQAFGIHTSTIEDIHDR